MAPRDELSGCREVVRADPERPGLHTLDSEDAVHPRIIGEHGAYFALAGCMHDEHRVLTVDVAYRSAERDVAALTEPLDERRVVVPARLLATTTRVRGRSRCPL